MLNRNLILMFLVLSLLFISGCGITGNVVAELDKSVIKNGEITNLEVEGRNTGDQVVNARLEIISEDPSKVRVMYDGNLEFMLYPDETTGVKIILIQGFSDHTSTKYEVTTRLIDIESGKVLDRDEDFVIVEK